jgi:hypothetical protein
MPTPPLPDLEGDPMVFEDLPPCIGRAIRPPLIGCSQVSEASAILPPADPGNWFLAMAVSVYVLPERTAFSFARSRPSRNQPSFLTDQRYHAVPLRDVLRGFTAAL